MPHRLDEVGHQLPVAPAMAIRFLLPNSLLARAEIGVGEVTSCRPPRRPCSP